MKPICVLGSGPAGLLAAHAVALAGRPLVIVSKPVKSVLSGAQFLHRAIPMLCDEEPDVKVTYRLEGDAATYRKKVYGEGVGPMLPGFVSFESLHDGQEQEAWNLIKAYDRLWDSFGSSLTEAEVTPEWVDKHKDDFELILSSIPAPALCRAVSGKEMVNFHHAFSSQGIWLADENIVPMNDNTVVYNGRDDQSWYRSSVLFGHGGTEWSTQGRKPPLPGLKEGIKPVANTCDCFPDVVRVGRFGTWQKGVLTHHAFIDTLKALGVGEDREVH